MSEYEEVTEEESGVGTATEESGTAPEEEQEKTEEEEDEPIPPGVRKFVLLIVFLPKNIYIKIETTDE